MMTPSRPQRSLALLDRSAQHRPVRSLAISRGRMETSVGHSTTPPLRRTVLITHLRLTAAWRGESINAGRMSCYALIRGQRSSIVEAIHEASDEIPPLAL